ncbi:hypothetical protein LXL04_017809 [Taraxacum kok-saghyz]
MTEAKLTHKRHRRLPAAGLCRWQSLPLQAAVPWSLPAANVAIWLAVAYYQSLLTCETLSFYLIHGDLLVMFK